jgi:hypothetical protein
VIDAYTSTREGKQNLGVCKDVEQVDSLVSLGFSMELLTGSACKCLFNEDSVWIDFANMRRGPARSPMKATGQDDEILQAVAPTFKYGRGFYIQFQLSVRIPWPESGRRNRPTSKMSGQEGKYTYMSRLEDPAVSQMHAAASANAPFGQRQLLAR